MHGQSFVDFANFSPVNTHILPNINQIWSEKYFQIAKSILRWISSQNFIITLYLLIQRKSERVVKAQLGLYGHLKIKKWIQS